MLRLRGISRAVFDVWQADCMTDRVDVTEEDGDLLLVFADRGDCLHAMVTFYDHRVP